MKEDTKRDNDRELWVLWLERHGSDKFYDAFVRTAQDAEATCQNCLCRIYLDIVEGGGVPDWRTVDGNYGCSESPDTVNEGEDAGFGSHVPGKLRRP